MIQQQNTSTSSKSQSNFRVAPARLNLFLIMIASCMLFAGVVSAYIVHMPDSQAKDAWTKFDLPPQFFWSLITIIASSVTMFLAYRNAKNDELEKNKLYLGITLALGILFCVFQFLGWSNLVQKGLFFVNPKPADISATYVYVITAFHAVHVLGGIILVLVTFVKSLQLKVHKKSMVLMGIANTYWHFIGILWIYLFLFIYFAH